MVNAGKYLMLIGSYRCFHGKIAIQMAILGQVDRASAPTSQLPQHERLPDRFQFLQDLLQRRKTLPHDSRTTNGVLVALGWWLMEHGIQAASCDQGHLLNLGMQAQFQHTVGGIAHQLDGAA